MPTEYFETTSLDELLKQRTVAGPVPNPSTQRRTILVVDDEHVIADTLVAIINGSGFHAVAAYNGKDAFDLISARVPDLLITDVCMPGMNGIQLGIRVRERFPNCKVLLFSGHAASTNLMDEARRDGYDFDFLSKPVHPRDLLECLKRCA